MGSEGRRPGPTEAAFSHSEREKDELFFSFYAPSEAIGMSVCLNGWVGLVALSKVSIMHTVHERHCRFFRFWLS